MPITINLLGEQQKEAIAHLYDPFKIVLRVSYAVGGAVVLGMLWMGFQNFQASRDRNRLRNQLESMSKEATALRVMKDERNRIYTQLVAFNKLAARRELWATQMEIIRGLLPPEIHLTEIAGDVREEKSARPAPEPSAAMPAAPAPGREMESEAPAPGPESSAPDTQVTTLTLYGVVRGSEPRKIIQPFLIKLRTDPKFSEQVEKPDRDIEWKGDIQPGPADGSGVREATFTIRCSLKPRHID